MSFCSFFFLYRHFYCWFRFRMYNWGRGGKVLYGNLSFLAYNDMWHRGPGWATNPRLAGSKTLGVRFCDFRSKLEVKFLIKTSFFKQASAVHLPRLCRFTPSWPHVFEVNLGTLNCPNVLMWVRTDACSYLAFQWTDDSSRASTCLRSTTAGFY